MKTIVLMMVGLSWSFFAHANDVLSGEVVNVIDGNTVEVLAEDNETYKIMLYGIDCPGLDQAYGEKAKQQLEKLLLKKIVNVNLKGKNRWGTRLGIIMTGEIDPRRELLKEGLAWTAEVNPDPEFEAIKQEARENGRGLWKEANPIPPWTFRRQKTMMQMKSS